MKEDLKEMRAAIGRMHEFLMALEKAGFTEEIIVEIINSKGNQLAGEMFNALPEGLRTKWKLSDFNFIFKVDFQKIEEQFKKVITNNHDEAIFDIANRKSYSDTTTEIGSKLFHFNYIISNDAAIKEMKKEEYRPATDYETLTFCQLNSEWLKHHKLCALGTFYKSGGVVVYSYYPVFYYSDELKRICIENHETDNGNPSSMRFLGVKIK